MTDVETKRCLHCKKVKPIDEFPFAKKAQPMETDEEWRTRRIATCRPCAAIPKMCPHRQYPSYCLICSGPDSLRLCACGRRRSACQPCGARIGCPHGLLMYCWRCDAKYCLRIWLNREYGCESWYESGRYPLMSTASEKELLGCELADATKILDRLYPNVQETSDYIMLWVIDGTLPLNIRYRVWNIALRLVGDLTAAGPGEAEAPAHAAAPAAAIAFLPDYVQAEISEGARLGERDVLLAHLA